MLVGALLNFPLFIAQVLPQFWQIPIVSLIVFVLFVPLDFFQNKFDKPNVHRAVKPLAVLFTLYPNPIPFLLVCCPVSTS